MGTLLFVVQELSSPRYHLQRMIGQACHSFAAMQICLRLATVTDRNSGALCPK
ncbi:hypothetical protein [Virgibacillus sediminis]|uniref:Uncharacterized protein n=1 Tax=Virgibacillus sediminis TaxID=202260 RepID=A0ABV7AA16_9BACI